MSIAAEFVSEIWGSVHELLLLLLELLYWLLLMLLVIAAEELIDMSGCGVISSID